MYLQPGITTSTENYWDNLRHIAALLQTSERILIGIGSGMSSSGGLSYGDPALAEQWFPEYASQGYRTIAEIQGLYWWYYECSPVEYWSFWARHIWHIRYESEVLTPYKDLLALLEGKDYFIITTNADGQLFKAKYPRERVFAPQGNYDAFQCSKACRREIYPNREMIARMITNMPDKFHIREEDLPWCPHCGAPLILNLRFDNTYVHEPHYWNADAYETFVQDAHKGSLLLLELGVGFNTPVFIRYPFEAITNQYPRAFFVRVNATRPKAPEAIAEKTISLSEDITKVLCDLRNMGKGEHAHDQN